MKIVWGEESIRWFHQASEYTQYHKKLAELLLREMPKRGTLCDMGCGAGLIDFELAPYFQQITCVDLDEEAVRSVEAEARRRKISNIQAVCADGASMQGQWDTILAVFHGGPNAFQTYFPMVKDRLILVTHGDAVGNFGPKKHKVKKWFDVKSFQERMDEQGVCYELKHEILEYGQPFQSREDAAAFVRRYTTPMTAEDMDAYLETHVIETGDKAYPLYIPNPKKMGIFIIRKEDNKT